MIPSPGIFKTKLPHGFLCSGINSGVRRRRPDLGIIISQVPSVAVGVFTISTCKAAPVLYCQKLLPATNIRAIITNSGQANAATGEQGIIDNQAMVDAAAKELNCASNQILSASTGVIGELLNISLINLAIAPLVNQASDVAEPFALAILTTDLVPKTVTTTVKLSKGDVTLTGICKGSGMLHPNMATMLGYILTDAQITPELAQQLLIEANDVSFNMISVDGDTSTNDCVFLMANGMSQVSVTGEEDTALFKQALTWVAQTLAKSIARDGEGATKLIEAKVVNAPDLALARKIARTLICSPLIKTAIHGESPNWGRILAHLGAIQTPEILLEKVQIKFQDHLVFANNSIQTYDKIALKKDLKKDTIIIEIDLLAGPYNAYAWGCDLSKEYVEINAGYVT